MGTCSLCRKADSTIAGELGVCLACIRMHPQEALQRARAAHRKSRLAFGLPVDPPVVPHGVPCNLCVNACRIPEGGRGYCGLRRNHGGRLEGVSSREGKLSWYHDPLPTNCVADWVCAGCSGAGFPTYALSEGPEYTWKNLAVFFHACSFNCLFCQNWHFREQTLKPGTATVADVLRSVDARTSCICFFGGDPAPQLPFALDLSRQALEWEGGRILRVCWETNGSMSRALLDQMIALSLESGGCIKFDLKAWDDHLHRALTGVTNKRTLENFRYAGRQVRQRPTPPLLIASTLLVPGYIDETEISALARFISSVDPDIPYSLLAFYPQFFMADLPVTSRAIADSCLEAAKAEGLTNVRLGNTHLLL